MADTSGLVYLVMIYVNLVMFFADALNLTFSVALDVVVEMMLGFCL